MPWRVVRAKELRKHASGSVARRLRETRDACVGLPVCSVLPVTYLPFVDEEDSGNRVDELVAHLYQQLRVLARSERRRSGGPDTLHTTALVNEVYVKLADAERLRFGEPRQFFSYAAQAMRHVLLDRAKLQMRLKREDSRLRVSLTDPDVEAVSVDPNDAVVLDAALTELLKVDSRAAQVVELHFFAGLGLQQIADLLDVHRRTVDRDWRFASAFLKAQLI